MRVLIVEDDADTRANLRDILELDDYRVETAGSAAEAVARNNWSDFSAVVLDRRLPDGDAVELLPRIRRLAPHAAVIMVTGHADVEGAISALRHGAADYILKPISPELLRATLGRAQEMRRLTLAKQRSEAAFRVLVEQTPCLIVILRPDRTLAYFSPYAEQVTGYPAAEVLGRDYALLFLPDTNGGAQVVGHIEQVLSGIPSREYESSLRCRDGTWRWILWNAHRLADYEGSPAVLAVGLDITARKRAEERALQSERLAAIGQMMAGLTHESRNALQRSKACLEMLALEVQDRPEALDLVARADRAQEHLQRLFDEVRGYAAPIVLSREMFDLGDLWREIWSNLAPLRLDKSIELREEFLPVDLRCEADRFALGQVFRNILENAISAAPSPGQVTVRCAAAELDGRPALRVAVLDNGPGFNAEQRLRVFEPFYTTKTKGTGLGMAIAKRIVQSHGGQIEVGQGSGCGAEIVVTLPRGAE